MSANTLSITRPDDWHLHLRDGAALQLTVPHAARYNGRAIVMPNLQPPLVTVDLAASYRTRILAARPQGSAFEPLMTLYLTDNTATSEILAASAHPAVTACKLYPAGATTNSDSGVTDITNIHGTLDVMQDEGIPLLIHGEVTDPNVDVYDREKVFIDQHLAPLLKDFPELRVVLEHITTAEAAQFVESGPANLAATITAHHLLYERNHMLASRIQPHLYCLPILKRRQHQEALLRVATGDNPRFFLGSDSAPHSIGEKESSCGCAGCYTAHASLELYAEVFEAAGALDTLEAFASHRGPDFYGLPRNSDRIILERKSWTIPDNYTYGDSHLKPLRSGEQIQWRLSSSGTKPHE